MKDGWIIARNHFIPFLESVEKDTENWTTDITRAKLFSPPTLEKKAEAQETIYELKDLTMQYAIKIYRESEN